MPCSLVFALRPKSAPAPFAEAGGVPGRHAAKSEVLRTIFGLDKTARSIRHQASKGAPPGLGNWDNSCYQNSVLQAFASIASLQEFLRNIPHGNQGGSSTDTTLSALRGIIGDLNNDTNSGRHIWTPAKLKSMSSWQQQDAQEYFSKIIDQIEKDIAVAVRAEQVPGKGTEPGCSGLLAEKASYGYNLSSHTEVGASISVDIAKKACAAARSFCRLQNPLEGLLAQRVGCLRCGYTEGLSLIPFNCMTLPLGKEWAYDIRDCLDSYTDLEYIEGVECAKCTLLRSRGTLCQLYNELANPATHQSATPLRDDTYKHSIKARLQAVTEALQDEDFAEATLSKKCQIPRSLRATTTKSRQAIVMRVPKCLVMHVNRSLFDETTGHQLKNYADVKFPATIDLGQWCIGSKLEVNPCAETSKIEQWQMDPSRSMLQNHENSRSNPASIFKLRAVISHLGRHENGHYVCYRKTQSWPTSAGDSISDDSVNSAHLENVRMDKWWRLSDEDVSSVTEEEVLAQGGAFMLFYERVEQSYRLTSNQPGPATSALAAEEASIEPEELIESGYVEELTAQSDEATKDLNSILEASSLATPAMSPNTFNVENIRPDLPEVLAEDVHPGRAGQELGHAISPSTLQTKPFSPSAMRTAGLTHRRSSDLSAFKSLHMVATS